MSYNQNDYVLRMIEQFFEALAKIVQSRISANPEKALEQIQCASQAYLNSDIGLFLQCTPHEILKYFKVSKNEFDAEKAIICADLLFELAILSESQRHLDLQMNAKVRKIKTLALNLYEEAITIQDFNRRSEYLKKISTLKEEILSSF